MALIPVLPAPYEPVFVDEVDDLLADLRRRAEQDAEEGTLVWAKRQRAPGRRLDCAWAREPDNLHCGVLLRPEFPAAKLGEVASLATVAAGVAVADLLDAMAELRFRWPTSLLINGGEAGRVAVDAPAPEDEHLEWLAIALMVKVNPTPFDELLPAASVGAATEDRPVTVVDILEGFSRFFLHWINRWADDGFEPVRKAWRQRGEGIGQFVEIDLAGEHVEGTAADIGPGGELLLDTSDRERRIVTVAEYLGLQTGGRP